jgi:hypothetical protein
MICGVADTQSGACETTFSNGSVAVCAAPASASRKPSTSTQVRGSSTLRDHSKNRLPGSARTASVNSRISSGNWSSNSGRTGHFTTMRITGPA